MSKRFSPWTIAAAIAFVAIMYALCQLGTFNVFAQDIEVELAGDCCTTSADCAGTKLCYFPSGGLADCSTNLKNYCK